MEILAIIPARGGSKGIPRKNIKSINGKPLIAWTIHAAQGSELINRIIVSTDDQEIADISREYGGEVFMRSPELATDQAPTIPVLQEVLESIEADVVVLLQATSPVRNKGLIDMAINRFLDRDADSLATGLICKFYEYGNYVQRRQDLKGWFYDDGNIYIFKAELLKKGDRYGKKMEKMVISREENVEIDDDFDFWLAEKVLKKQIDEGKMEG